MCNVYNIHVYCIYVCYILAYKMWWYNFLKLFCEKYKYVIGQTTYVHSYIKGVSAKDTHDEMLFLSLPKTPFTQTW